MYISCNISVFIIHEPEPEPAGLCTGSSTAGPTISMLPCRSGRASAVIRMPRTVNAGPSPASTRKCAQWVTCCRQHLGFECAAEAHAIVLKTLVLVGAPACVAHSARIGAPPGLGHSGDRSGKSVASTVTLRRMPCYRVAHAGTLDVCTFTGSPGSSG
jgi:hypothetical protein